MRVLDTPTILAAMAQVSPRERRRARIAVRTVPRDGLVVVAQGNIPVIVMSSRLASAGRSARLGPAR